MDSTLKREITPYSADINGTLLPTCYDSIYNAQLSIVKVIVGNIWFIDYYDAPTYGLLVMCFNKYMENMQHVGASAVFDGVSSIDDLKKKYGMIGS